jgi:hypothetical protein
MSRVKIKPKWLRLSEETNALDYLEQAYQYIHQTDKNVFAWKWVILALHGALYGFAISACRGTNPDNVTRTSANGKVKLISFDDALELCQNPDWMETACLSKPLRLTLQQKKSIRQLKQQFRNNFEHYIPRGWSIEIHGMPQISLDVLAVIRFLATESSVFVHLNHVQKKKIKSIVFQSKHILQNSQLFKEAMLLKKM